MMDASATAGTQQQQQPPYFLVYYWRQKSDFLYFKVRERKAVIIIINYSFIREKL